LMLDPGFDWTFTLSDPSIMRPLPIPLSRSLQAVWMLEKPGQTMINATGAVHCDTGMACIQLARIWQATVVVSGSGAVQPVRYPAGWNIVAAPDGTTLPLVLYGWDPVSGTYQQVPSGGPLKGGQGYWTFASQDVNLGIGKAGAEVMCVSLPAGKWTLIGNPSGISTVTVNGIDSVWAYDPTAGAYQMTSSLKVGQGAWAYSASGATISLSAGPLARCAA
jgi:hypothetical protein